MGKWLARKYKRVFITGPDYALGIEMTKGFKDGWFGAGDPPVGEVVAPLNTNDYAPYLTQIKNANPDCVFASFAGGDSVRFVKQFDEFGLKKQILLTGFGYLTDEDNVRAQGDSAIGVMTNFTSCYTLNYSGEQEVRRTIQESVTKITRRKMTTMDSMVAWSFIRRLKK